MGKEIFSFIWDLFNLGFEVGSVYVTFWDIIIYTVLGSLLIGLFYAMLGGE